MALEYLSIYHLSSSLFGFMGCCVLVSGCGPTAEEEAFQRSIDETIQLRDDYLNQ
jgi:hypothetical protein